LAEVVFWDWRRTVGGGQGLKLSGAERGREVVNVRWNHGVCNASVGSTISSLRLSTIDLRRAFHVRKHMNSEVKLQLGLHPAVPHLTFQVAS